MTPRRRVTATAAAVAAVAGLGGAAFGIVYGTAAAAGGVPRPARCVTFDVAGRPATGMPWDEPVTFCGTGLPAGQWKCPAGSPVLGPGTRLACTRD